MVLSLSIAWLMYLRLNLLIEPHIDVDIPYIIVTYTNCQRLWDLNIIKEGLWEYSVLGASFWLHVRFETADPVNVWELLPVYTVSQPTR
jgi:hypothetical protein